MKKYSEAGGNRCLRRAQSIPSHSYGKGSQNAVKTNNFFVLLSEAPGSTRLGVRLILELQLERTSSQFLLVSGLVSCLDHHEVSAWLEVSGIERYLDHCL